MNHGSEGVGWEGGLYDTPTPALHGAQSQDDGVAVGDSNKRRRSYVTRADLGSYQVYGEGER